MSTSPYMRIGRVLLAYFVVGWLVLIGSGWVGRILALPSLFDTLLRVGLVAGIPLAILIAWRYPELGDDASRDSDDT